MNNMERDKTSGSPTELQILEIIFSVNDKSATLPVI